MRALAWPGAEDDRSPLRSGVAAQFPAEEEAHAGPGGRDVDDGIPEAHQGEHNTRGVGEGEGDEGGVDEGVDSVD